MISAGDLDLLQVYLDRGLGDAETVALEAAPDRRAGPGRRARRPGARGGHPRRMGPRRPRRGTDRRPRGRRLARRPVPAPALALHRLGRGRRRRVRRADNLSEPPLVGRRRPRRPRRAERGAGRRLRRRRLGAGAGASRAGAVRRARADHLRRREFRHGHVRGRHAPGAGRRHARQLPGPGRESRRPRRGRADRRAPRPGRRPADEAGDAARRGAGARQPLQLHRRPGLDAGGDGGRRLRPAP